MPDSERVELSASARQAPAGAEDLGALEPSSRVEVSLYLRRNPDRSPPFDPVQEALRPPGERRYLTAEQAEQHYGAAPEDVDAVLRWARTHNLQTVRIDRLARSVRLAGSAAEVADAFGVDLRGRRLGEARFHGHDGPVLLPSALGDTVDAVFGLDTRPLGRPFFRLAPDGLQAAIQAIRTGGAQPANTYLPPQLAALYGFPNQPAAGQTVAVLAFNDPSTPGGYEPSVLQQYLSGDLGLPMPQITDVTVQGPGNVPGDGSNPDDATPEVYLDLSIVGSLATGAKIVVYFTEFTEQGWVDALSRAAADTTNDPSVISISYGNPEDGPGSAWTAAAVSQVNQAFEVAAARGKTITAAAGDNGAGDGVSSGVHVDFPASSPWVLACGGTRVESTGGHISSEVVWNDLVSGNGATGGGISAVFPLPSWQVKANVPSSVASDKPGRGVPDVASLADPQTPFIVAQPGGTGGVGGTSAAAPLWAALIARCNAALGAPVGFLNPKLYDLAAANPLRDITSGDNAAPGGQGYPAGPGWDACTGFGSPGGDTLLTALQQPPNPPPTPGTNAG